MMTATKKRLGQKRAWLTALLVMCMLVLPGLAMASSVSTLDVVYLGGANASNSNSGASVNEAVATINHALDIVSANGIVVLCGNARTEVGYHSGNNLYSSLDPKGNVTVTSEYNNQKYPDAVLTFDESSYLHGDITFKGIKIGVDAGVGAAHLVSSRVSSKVVFDHVDTSNALSNFQIIHSQDDATFDITVKNCSSFKADFIQHSNKDLTLTLDNSVVYNYEYDSTGLVGNVVLKNNSTLAIVESINNLTSDGTSNAIAMYVNSFSYPNLPPITIKGEIKTEAGFPIVIERYDKTAGELIPLDAEMDGKPLIQTDTPNASLTADRFTTMDNERYSLKKEGDAIVYIAKVVVTFHAGVHAWGSRPRSAPQCPVRP